MVAKIMKHKSLCFLSPKFKPLAHITFHGDDWSGFHCMACDLVGLSLPHIP